MWSHISHTMSSVPLVVDIATERAKLVEEALGYQAAIQELLHASRENLTCLLADDKGTRHRALERLRSAPRSICEQLASLAGVFAQLATEQVPIEVDI